MNRIKGGIVAIALLFAVGFIVHDIRADALPNHDRSSVSLNVVTTGDTAQVFTVTVKLTSDSGLFKDSVFFTNDTSQHIVDSFRTPVQVMILTPDAGAVDSSTDFSIDFAFAGGDTLGFDVNIGDAYVTVAKLCDTITSLINATTNLTDTVAAEDSGTYVKILSLFSEEVLTGRWSMVIDTSGGTEPIPDTASQVYDRGDIVDTLVGLINAGDSSSVYVTAARTSDTTFTVTSNDPGVPIHVVSVTGSDTMAVAATQGNVTSWSAMVDTILLSPKMFLTNGANWTGINSFFKITASSTTAQGLGLKDSVYLQLWSGLEKGGAMEYTILGADTCAACPCSLEYVLPPDTARAAITIGEDLYLWIRIADSASDSTFTVHYPLNLDYILYNQK